MLHRIEDTQLFMQMSMCSKAIVVLASVCLSVFRLPAQSLRLSGTVRDPSQAAVVGAIVTLQSATGPNWDAVSDSSGGYVFDGLNPGGYRLTIVRKGLATATESVLLAGESKTLDVTLAVGPTATYMAVTGVAGKATASRMEIPDRDLPVQVSSISEETLLQQGASDLVTLLRNASGVDARRFYGAYEYYTIRGFNESDVVLVDGMRLEGNRLSSLINNVEQVEVLKGPSSILYGAQALSGAINIIRKKPQTQRGYDFFYRGGRFNSHQVGGGATGQIFNFRQLMYRADASYENADGWRGAGGRRVNLSPSVTWLMSNSARVTIHQAVNQVHFSGDGGVPVDIVNLSAFDPSRRFSTPYDFSRARDSQTHVLLNASLSSTWEVRNSYFQRWTDDEYFVTEGLTYDMTTNALDRYALYFKHHRRPKINQTDAVGRFRFLGMRHIALLGYEYADHYNHTDRTADGGDFYLEPVGLLVTEESQPPIASFSVVRVDYFTNRTDAFFWQDQISLTDRLKLNIGGRFDDYHRITRRDPQGDGRALSRGPETILDQTAYTYRAGLVYELPKHQQIYAVSSSSFQPVTIRPTDGPPLKPELGRSYEAGHRWLGLDGRLSTSFAVYALDRNDVVVGLGQGRYEQAARQSSRGVDLDVRGTLPGDVSFTGAYGYTRARFQNYVASGDDLSGNRPRFAPQHTANIWMYKMWRSGFTAGLGTRYLGPLFTNNTNTVRLGGWTTFSGSAGYRRGLFEWSANAENLLNRKRYFLGSDYDSQVYPGAPLNVFATVRLRF